MKTTKIVIYEIPIMSTTHTKTDWIIYLNFPKKTSIISHYVVFINDTWYGRWFNWSLLTKATMVSFRLFSFRESSNINSFNWYQRRVGEHIVRKFVGLSVCVYEFVCVYVCAPTPLD